MPQFPPNSYWQLQQITELIVFESRAPSDPDPGWMLLDDDGMFAWINISLCSHLASSALVPDRFLLAPHKKWVFHYHNFYCIKYLHFNQGKEKMGETSQKGGRERRRSKWKRDVDWKRIKCELRFLSNKEKTFTVINLRHRNRLSPPSTLIGKEAKSTIVRARTTEISICISRDLSDNALAWWVWELDEADGDAQWKGKRVSDGQTRLFGLIWGGRRRDEWTGDIFAETIDEQVSFFLVLPCQPRRSSPEQSTQSLDIDDHRTSSPQSNLISISIPKLVFLNCTKSTSPASNLQVITQQSRSRRFATLSSPESSLWAVSDWFMYVLVRFSALSPTRLLTRCSCRILDCMLFHNQSCNSWEKFLSRFPLLYNNFRNPPEHLIHSRLPVSVMKRSKWRTFRREQPSPERVGRTDLYSHRNMNLIEFIVILLFAHLCWR